MTGYEWLVLSLVPAVTAWVGGGQVAGLLRTILWTELGVYEPVSPLITEVDA